MTTTAVHETAKGRLFLMTAYLLLIITCYTTTKAVRDSLFVSEVGTSKLPYLYMLIAGSMAGISSIYPAALRRLGLMPLIQVTSFLSVVSLAVFWWVLAYEHHTTLYLLYIWVSLFGAITASQAWSVANHVFDAREARRSFGWIGLGGVIGGIAGGTLTRIVAKKQGSEFLLLICAVLMMVTIAILYYLSRSEGWASPIEPVRTDDTGGSVFRTIRESPYLSLIVCLLVAGVVVEAFIDFEFKSVSQTAFASRDRLTSFFGKIASYGGMLALAFQLLVTNRLLRRFGVGFAILFLPAALLSGFAIAAIWPTLWALTLIKLIDGCLSYSVHRSGMELLYVPVPAKVRASVKAMIDLFVDRAGRAVGGVLLLALTAGLSLSISSLSIVAALCLAIWLIAAFAVRRNYIQAFRSALEKKVIEPETLEVRSMDHSVVANLIQALSSPDERQVLYALDLLGKVQSSRWVHHVPPLLKHDSSTVRVEAIRRICAASKDSASRFKEFLGHEDYKIVLATIHCLAKYEVGGRDLISPELIERALTTSGEHEVVAKTAAVRGLALAEFPGKAQFLDRLLQDANPEIVRQAAHTAGEIRYEKAIPILISLLERGRLRRAAREALLELGEPARCALEAAFQDEHSAYPVRVRIPKVLSLCGDPKVVVFLLDSLDRSPLRLHLPILKALNRLRERSEDVTFEMEWIIERVRRESERHARLREIHQAVRPADGEAEPRREQEILALLARAVHERMDESVERAFRLLALNYSPADIRGVFYNFTSRPAHRASAVEFLDNLIEPELRSLVMPLVEDPVEESGMTRNEAIRILSAEGDDWLRTIVDALVAPAKAA